jgi:hypothetical protein
VLSVLDNILASRGGPGTLDLWCTETLAVELSGLKIQIRASSAAPIDYARNLFTPSTPLWKISTEPDMSTITMRTISLPAHHVSELVAALRVRSTNLPRPVRLHAHAPAAWYEAPNGQVLVTEPHPDVAPQIIARHSTDYIVITSDESDAMMNVARHVREIGYRRAQNRGWTCLHASAAAINGRGVLIVGDSGAGKSSLALAIATSSKGAFLSNDRTMIAATSANTLKAIAMPGPIRLNGGTLDALGLNHAREWVLARPKPDRGSDWKEFHGAKKLQILPAEWYKQTGTPLSSEMPVDLVIFPEVMPNSNDIEVLSLDASRTREQLAAQCMSPRDNVYVCDWLGIRDSTAATERRHVANLLDLLQRGPALRIRFGTGVQYSTLADKVRECLDEVAPT